MSQSQDSSLMEDELTCPICLDIFAQPQMLCCGHNFCASCLEDVLRKQEETGSYKCPECAWDFQERPSPKRNFKLAGIVERFQASQRSSAGTQRPLSCDYCPCAAERTCLKCESNFCSDHLRPHLEKPSLRLHRLAEPSAERGDQCQEHDEVCKMFCSSCKQCVCTCCVLEARHHKHHITSFKHAQQGIKDWLEGRLQRLTARLEVCEGSLGQQCQEEEQVKTKLEGLRQRGRQCCEGLRRAVEDYQAQLEQCLDREEQGALEELQKMATLNQGQRESLAELCTSLKLLQEERDPLHCIQGFLSIEERVESVLQEEQGPSGAPVRKPDPLKDCQQHWDAFREQSQKLLQVLQSLKLRRQVHLDLSFDPNTASRNLILSDDRQTVTGTKQSQPYPEHDLRFKHHPQVLCAQSFTAGTYCWEVEVVEAGNWAIGVASRSIPRKSWDNDCLVGYNADSWCLYSVFDSLVAWHNNQRRTPHSTGRPRRVRLLLDFHDGTLSFYSVLPDRLLLLHTFKEKFTQVLCPCFWVSPGTKLTLHKVTEM